MTKPVSGEAIAATVFGRRAALGNRRPSPMSIGRPHLARQVERKDVQWRFAILDTPSINAMAFPGGIVVVTHGCMRAWPVRMNWPPCRP